MDHNRQRSNSSTRSFRIDSYLSEILDEEAERMGISVNALVNIILKGYSDFSRYLSKLDLVIVNRDLLKSLLEFNSNEDVYSLGLTLGETIPKDTILFWKKKLSSDSVFEYIDKIMCRYGLLGTYDESIQSGTKIMVIRHRLGQKGSQFIHGYLRAAIKTIGGIDSTFEVTDSSVKIQL